MCPGTVYGYADRNSREGSVVWREPYATDNHDKIITITKTGSAAPNRKIPEGIYQVTYNAVDSTGNKAVPCVVKVVMKGKKKKKQVCYKKKVSTIVLPLILYFICSH